MNELLRDTLFQRGKFLLDSADGDDGGKTAPPSLPKKGRPEDNGKNNGLLDSAAATYASQDIALKAVHALHQWTEDDDLSEGETFADRLEALMIGVADANKDGEIDDDEAEVIETALNEAWDYLLKKGIEEEDVDLVLNEWDADAAERVREALASALPDGEDESHEDIDSFVFDDEDSEAAVMDAAYRKVYAIRDGKKRKIKKRISGKVKLSAAQKAGIRKARMKSHTASAMLHRMKSMRLRKRSGLSK